MLIYIAVGLCALALAFLIARYDLYEKEPWPLLVLALSLGMLSGWLAGRIEDVLLSVLGDMSESIAVQAWLASLTEESLKLAVVLCIALVFRKEFNDPLDGLIYGAFAGLGAAMEESWFYLSLADEMRFYLIGTEVVRLLLHVFLGGLAGFGVGLARCRIGHWPSIFSAAMIANLLLHFTWDYQCGIPAQSSEPMLNERLIAIGLMLGGASLFGLCVYWGNIWSRAVHAPQSAIRLWGWPFSMLVANREDSESPNSRSEQTEDS